MGLVISVGIRHRVVLGGVALMAFLGGIGVSGWARKAGAGETERETLALSRLTNPFLECVGEINADLGLVRVREAVLRYLREAQEADSSLVVSLYARDLNNGPWIGIGEKEPFLPASLAKVPVMLYILAHAEGDPGILQRELVFPGPDAMVDEDNMERLSEELRMQAGEKFTYQELLYRMIVHSDNHARELLMTGITEEDINGLMATMHSGGEYRDGEFFISPKAYSTFFRVLYNATFIGRPLSEYALDLLSQSAFQVPLRRSLPEGVPVASKFGFRDDRNRPGGGISLHECGIVYQPGTPYVLCLMTSSTESPPDRLAEIIADISRIVWEGKKG